MTIVYRNSLDHFYRNSPAIPDLLMGIERSDVPQNSAQYRAWSNSLQFMQSMLMMANLPRDCGVLIEYRLPSTSRRVDFIITGHDVHGSANFVIIELKQWSTAKAVSGKSGIVIANVAGHRVKETNHPCYQAWSYKVFLENMLDTVSKNHLHAFACAYLHNYKYKGLDTDPLSAEPNRELVESAPLFGRNDRDKLGSFISQHVGRGDGNLIMELLASGQVVPSKRLVDAIGIMFDENKTQAFTLIDEQKNAYETAMRAVRETPLSQKRCVIITGGPGTGKSVVAMTLLVDILRKFRENDKRRNVRFVSPTSSFRQAMISMLVGSNQDKKERKRRKDLAQNLFCGSMNFNKVAVDTPYHCLICDEAHRLHSHQYGYAGKNQIEDIIQAARVSIFFVDDNQALRPYDIGSVESIIQAAKKFNVPVEPPVALAAQFRCQGADGFLNWLAVVLGLAEAQSTGNAHGWDKTAFDFDIVDTPEEVVAFVNEKNRPARLLNPVAGRSVISGARLLAGYAWPWTKEGNDLGEVPDVDLGSVKLPWNNRKSSYEWAIDPATMLRNEVGCVHTSQGLEFDWVGVFIGKDLRYDPDKKMLFADIDNYYDKGGKNGLGKNKAERSKNLLKYVCRCYRVLLSRGVRGARIYCCDKNLAEYLKAELAKTRNLSAN